MGWSGLLFLIPYLISLAISTGVGFYAWRRRDVTGAGSYALVAWAGASWTLGYIFELLSPSLEAKVFWDNFQFVGMFVTPLAILSFALEYTGHKLPHSRRTWAALAVFPIVCLLLVITDSFHGLIRPDAWLVPGEPFAALGYDFTPLVWLMVVYLYGLLIADTLILAGGLIRAHHLYRAQVGTVLAGVLVPWLGTIPTILGILPDLQRDLMPLTLGASNLIVAWGLFRYRLLDIVPVARRTVFESISDAVIVVDTKGRVIDLNSAARQTVRSEPGPVVGQTLDQVFSNWPDLLERFRDVDSAHTEIAVEGREGLYHYDLSISPLPDRRGEAAGRVIVVHNITEHREAELALQQAREELEKRVDERTASQQATNKELQRTVEKLAGEIAEHKKTEEALQRHAEQLEALRQMGLELAAQLDLDALLYSIVSRAVELLAGSIGTLYLYRADQDLLEPVVSIGTNPSLAGIALQPGQGLAGKVWQTGTPITVENYMLWEGRPEFFKGQNARAVVGVPVRWGKETLGVLDIATEAPGALSPADSQLLSLFATQAAIAIENARLYEEGRRRNRELALLNRVIAASAASQEGEAILETVCRELIQALDLTHAAALLLDEEGDQIRVAAESPAQGWAAALAEGPGLQDLMAGTTLQVIDGVQADPRLDSVRDLAGQQGIVSLLFVPLLTGEDIVGALVLGDDRSGFSANVLNLCRGVAEQVSGALVRARLTRTQQRLSAVVEQAAEAVIITDTESTILYVNPAFEQILGFSRAEAIGQTTALFKSGKHKDAFYEGLWTTIRAGQVWQGRITNRKKDDSLCINDLIITPVRNQAGQLVNYVATMRDVTHEVELEKQFQQAQRMESLGRLAGGIAHDFNNLLTVIRLSSQLIERQLRPEDPVSPLAREIWETSKRAAKLTQQLLSFSRRDMVEPRLLDLNEIVRETGTMLQRIVGEQVRLERTLAPDLWPILADPAQMEQVLVNLVVNARDAMPEGGALTIETANVVLDEAYVASHVDAQPGEHVQLAVSDTGTGMTEEVKSHIFEPFYTTKARGKGTGLGLSTVFGIVTRGGGHIHVYSEVDQGTTFRIHLPRIVDTALAVQDARSGLRDLARQDIRQARTGTETVLVAEDDAAVRTQAQRALRIFGYRVLEAGDGREALAVSRAHDGPIHLLLTDLVMPEIGGQELVAQIQTERPEMQVMFMSGYTDNMLAHKGGLPEGAAFLPKPFTLESLSQAVRAALDRGA